MHPRRGLYERLISERFEDELRELVGELTPQREPLRVAEAADRLALYLGRLVGDVLDQLFLVGPRFGRGDPRDPGILVEPA